jgi:hypothetical protein
MYLKSILLTLSVITVVVLDVQHIKDTHITNSADQLSASTVGTNTLKAMKSVANENSANIQGISGKPSSTMGNTQSRIPAAQTTAFTISLPAPFVVHPGGAAWIVAGVRPGSVCTITVTYESGSSIAAGLYTKTSSSQGQIRWDWNIGSRTNLGKWPVGVTCTSNGQTSSKQTYILVE